ncbi:MAG: alpha/beta hydrolase [Flavobacteriaceae bacterium]
MNALEKYVSYTSKNSYSCLNKLTDKTKNVWVVFHGIGYLSRYFLKYFNELNKEQNFIISPQAPSKYYLNSEYKHVGASWLTKEDRDTSMENLLNYLDEIMVQESVPKNCRLIILGFSQGVSVAMRWVAKRKVQCHLLVLYAGGIPDELNKADFAHLEGSSSVKILIGDADEYLNEQRLKTERRKIEAIFNNKAELVIFEGTHEVKKELINGLV